MPVRLLAADAETTGTTGRSSDHLVPFQCSASARLPPEPTAVQLLRDRHDTDARAPVAWAGFPGVGWKDHLTPFQRSASVTWAPGTLSPMLPTEVQASAEEHDTASSCASAPGRTEV